LPSTETDLPDLTLEERLALLAGQEIVEASLGEDAPHLILTFDSGRVFFLNGARMNYECWNLGTVTQEEEKKWLIVAIPGNDIALFPPSGATRSK
jgi:hypothetical protein